MNKSETSLSAAWDRSEAARARFRSATETARVRLSPTVLREEASAAVNHKIDETRDAARQTAYRHPILLTSVAGAAVLFLFRRPLAKLGKASWHLAQGATNKLAHWRQSND
jgi:hypothetical protein